MYEKFTERARKVMSLARQESQRLNSDAIKTEHVLLGIVEEAGGVAAKVLKNLGGDLDRVRKEVERLVAPIPTSPTAMLGQLPISPRVKQALVLAEEAAAMMGHPVIGTEHILMGLLKENEGVAAQVLINLGLNLSEVKTMVLEVLGVKEGTTPRVVAEPVPVPTNDKWTWQKIGTIEVLSIVSEGETPSTLTMWKVFLDSYFTDVYAVGRTQETAIVIRAADWEMVCAMIKVHSEKYSKFH